MPLNPLWEIIDRHVTDTNGKSRLSWPERQAMYDELSKYIKTREVLAATNVLLEVEND